MSECRRPLLAVVEGLIGDFWAASMNVADIPFVTVMLPSHRNYMFKTLAWMLENPLNHLECLIDSGLANKHAIMRAPPAGNSHYVDLILLIRDFTRCFSSKSLITFVFCFRLKLSTVGNIQNK